MTSLSHLHLRFWVSNFSIMKNILFTFLTDNKLIDGGGSWYLQWTLTYGRLIRYLSVTKNLTWTWKNFSLILPANSFYQQPSQHFLVLGGVLITSQPLLVSGVYWILINFQMVWNWDMFTRMRRWERFRTPLKFPAFQK